MHRFVNGALVALLVIAGGNAQAAALSAELGYTVDQDGGHALDLDLSLAPTRYLTLYAGAGQSQGSEATSDLTGTLFNAGASLHGERAGLSLAFDSFDDSSNYQARTLAARAWLAAGDFEFALLARQRDLAVEVTLELPLRTVRRELDFAGTGAGLQVSFARESFSAYAMALRYDYDQDFDDFIGLINSPQLELRPRIEALVGSFITQTQGAIDRQAGVGCEFGFGRHSLAVDLSFVHDAVLDAGSSSLALGYRRAQNAHFDWGLTAGMVDSDAFGNIGFLGVQIGLAN
jgi:hypothetical protein